MPPTENPLTNSEQILGHAQQMLNRKGANIKDIIGVLKVFRDNVDDADVGSVTNAEDASPPQREILSGLIGFLESIP